MPIVAELSAIFVNRPCLFFFLFSSILKINSIQFDFIQFLFLSKAILYLRNGSELQATWNTMLGLLRYYGIWSNALHKECTRTFRTNTSCQYRSLATHSTHHFDCVCLRLHSLSSILSSNWKPRALVINDNWQIHFISLFNFLLGRTNRRRRSSSQRWNTKW